MFEIDVKDFLSVTASICTIIQFLSGVLVCQKIVKNQSTGDLSVLPFLVGSLSTSLWLRYGFFLQERPVILVNTIGATLFFSYTAVFFIYSLKKAVILRQFLLGIIFLVGILFYIQNKNDIIEAKEHLGLIASFFTITFFASPLATLLHVLRTKNSDSLPFPLIFCGFIVSGQWFLFGVLLEDKYIMVTNFLGCSLSAFQLALCYIYPSKHKGTTDYV